MVRKIKMEPATQAEFEADWYAHQPTWCDGSYTSGGDRTPPKVRGQIYRLSVPTTCVPVYVFKMRTNWRTIVMQIQSSFFNNFGDLSIYHGVEPCDCPNYLIALTQMGAFVEKEKKRKRETRSQRIAEAIKAGVKAHQKAKGQP